MYHFVILQKFVPKLFDPKRTRANFLILYVLRPQYRIISTAFLKFERLIRGYCFRRTISRNIFFYILRISLLFFQEPENLSKEEYFSAVFETIMLYFLKISHDIILKTFLRMETALLIYLRLFFIFQVFEKLKKKLKRI